MMKPWSIATAVRNPGRLKEFLSVLNRMEGEAWNSDSQIKYQVLLIKERLYGYGNPQFYRGLPPRMVELINDVSRDIPLKTAMQIFQQKGYEDPPMRGRQSFNPLKKFGFAAVDNGKIAVTGLGRELLADGGDAGEVLFKSFLRWQFPNPDAAGYSGRDGWDIKPFVGTLRLIDAVNRKEAARGKKPKGISRDEFCLFVPTLANYKDIGSYADKIIALRGHQEGKPSGERQKAFDACRKGHVGQFISSADAPDVDQAWKNLQDYGDNIIRYFRLTRYIAFRGEGRYVDLEPRRAVETAALFASDNGQAREFQSQADYAAYIAGASEPRLPWETREKLAEIANGIVADIRHYESRLGSEALEQMDFEGMDERGLKGCISELRARRRELQLSVRHLESQESANIEEYIRALSGIHDFDESFIMLEKFTALGLQAMNDALKIQPNYPVGDDDEPTHAAPAGVPDIECFYESFNAICEVTMLSRQDQWVRESQPVMRHLRDFEEKHRGRPAYCVFVAPGMSRDAVNMFWHSIKHGHEGARQKIVPLTIGQLVSILETLLQMKAADKRMRCADILRLYDGVVDAAGPLNDSKEWIAAIPGIVSDWRKSMIS